MKSALLAFFLTISVLENPSPVGGSKGLQDAKSPVQNLDSKCNAYYFSLLKPILENNAQVKAEADYLKNRSSTIEDLQNKLVLANSQIKCKDDVIMEKNEIIKEKNELIKEQLKIKDDKVNIVKNLQSQLANAECKIQINELVISKNNEINEHIVQFKNIENLIKLRDETIKLLNEQIRNKDEKEINIAAKIKDLQARLESAEELLSVRNKEISAKSEELRTKDEIILDQIEKIKTNDEKVNNMTANVDYLKSQLVNAELQIQAKEDMLNTKDMELKSKEDLIRIKDDEANVKSNQLKVLSEQILLKDITKDSCPKGRPNGIYIIKTGMTVFEAPCNSSGWMTIQRRQDGSVSFNRYWDDYKNGFGDLKTEFFIGLEKLYQLTKKPHELYIKLELNGTSKYALYDDFKIGSEQQQYELSTVGDYSGTAGGALEYHTKMKFSTADRDNDHSFGNCAKKHAGGWWFKNCLTSHLNGKYYTSGFAPHDGVSWLNWNNDLKTSLTYVEMMIRPFS